MTTLIFTRLLLPLAMAVPTAAMCQPDYLPSIVRSAQELYQSLGPTQKMAAGLQFGDTARLKWNNLPVGLRARAGVSIGNMTVAQRQLVHRILSASLSSQGYLKATSVMHLDDLLNRYYDSLYYQHAFSDTLYEQMKALKWSHRNYFFAFFGMPSDSVWGYKFEGHHLSLNFTISHNHISVTPFFIGTDPAEYPITEYAGWRILGEEEDLGMQLIQSLSPAQQHRATMSTGVPADIITAAESGKRLVDNWGLPSSAMTPAQRQLLQYIIREFVFNMEYPKAVIEYGKIVKAGLDKIYFGWIGPYDEHKAHYFILNGPGFLIELDNAGFGGQGNHIHAIWREKGNEYGEDLLRQHYQSEKH